MLTNLLPTIRISPIPSSGRLLLDGLLWIGVFFTSGVRADELSQEFVRPPDSSWPGVYWYFMDGNLDRDQMTADLESMKKAGIGNLVFLEVNVGVPRGPVDFLSDPWQKLFAHAVAEAERLGIEITLGSGPGWTGSGGPWIKAQDSMQHLVASRIDVEGPSRFYAVLPAPLPRKPFFGTVSADLEAKRQAYCDEVTVLAFPTPVEEATVNDIDEKALVYRAPFSSAPGIKPRLPSLAKYSEPPSEAVIDPTKIIDLTDRLKADGTLDWQVPDGAWTVMRFAARNNGANTRPAPTHGYGFECDKLRAAALLDHLENYTGKLLEKVGPRKNEVGWTMLHMDSWEMGSQNWTPELRNEFRRRRGYDPLPFYPAYVGCVVESLEQTERFLWDLRITCQELVLENHAGLLKDYAHKHGFGLSIEPYDMNPTADLDLGAVADVPMCEFWSTDLGFNTSYSVIEASSIAHTLGCRLVAAEAFTANANECWQQYPGSMKNQGDWAFCAGINRFVYHTFAHKPLGDAYRPGMTMGPYGVHWDRGQTWWSMVPEYHRYVSRCQHMLRQGRAVADILYLTPEGAPHVFRPPASAMSGDEFLPDKRGFSFDGCSPNMLRSHAEVKNGRVAFRGGTSYSVLVLAQVETMTPELLSKLDELIRAGATVIGSPPLKSPSLTNFPRCDHQVREKSLAIWGGLEPPKTITRRDYGKGRVFWGGPCSLQRNKSDGSVLSPGEPPLYPSYAVTAGVMEQLGHRKDFESQGPLRYVHRRTVERDIYFVSNRTAENVQNDCQFRALGQPELWNPISGEILSLPEYRVDHGRTIVPMRFDSHESFFVVFPKTAQSAVANSGDQPTRNFPEIVPCRSIQGTWTVSFDPHWGGPEQVEFPELVDWSGHQNSGIKYYSGIATYRNTFDLSTIDGLKPNARMFLDLGMVHNVARVRLNGKDLGVVWTAPRRVEMTDVLRRTENRLEIEVANLWANRLIGDQQPENRNVRQVRWDSGLLEGKEFATGRYTFTTHNRFKSDSPLIPSGLIGPVSIQVQR
jgi:hypothetical protein